MRRESLKVCLTYYTTLGNFQISVKFLSFFAYFFKGNFFQLFDLSTLFMKGGGQKDPQSSPNNFGSDESLEHFIQQ